MELIEKLLASLHTAPLPSLEKETVMVTGAKENKRMGKTAEELAAAVQVIKSKRAVERKEAAVYASKRLERYNMSYEEYEWMLARQGGVCAICFNAETLKSKNGNLKSLSIDHCHSTGMIRGLLCNSCNSLLGAAKDNTQTLSAALCYLNEARERYVSATPEELKRAKECPALT